MQTTACEMPLNNASLHRQILLQYLKPTPSLPVMSSRALAFIFSLLSYAVLSIAYFVERDHLLSLLIWVGLLALKFLFKPLREQAPLFLLVGLCFAFLDSLHRLSPYLSWPLDFYLTTAFGFLLLKFILKRENQKLKWSFKFTRFELASILIINVPAIAVLLWYYKTHPEVAQMWPALDMPAWAIPLVVLAVAAINGLREEIFYRGLLQPSSAASPAWFIVGLQAVLFGFLHFSNAFPQGWIGVFLTGLWGAAIAIQYQYFKSISLAWVTHAVADAIMFTIILNSR